jgi:hypothetical protein
MRTRQKADPQNGRFPLGAIADVAVRALTFARWSRQPVPAARRFRLASFDRGRSRLLSRGYRWFESISLQQTVSLSPAVVCRGREPRLSAWVCAAGLATGSAETPGFFDIAPTGSNVSVGPNSSTAVRADIMARMTRRSQQTQVFSALIVREFPNSDLV